MKYLCLIYDAESRMPATALEGPRTMMAEYAEFTESIAKSGHLLGGEALQRTGQAVTVRVRGGKVARTDGPFAETKEQLGGYYLIEATDLPDAVQVAARIPSAKTGSIEVRPIQVFG